MTRLLSSTGTVAHLNFGEQVVADALAPLTQPSYDSLMRSAILVHSAPGGEKIVFKSSDGEIAFDAARIQNIVKCQNQKTLALAVGYGGIEKMPVGAFTPILDQHSDESSHNVGGRLIGLLRHEIRDVPGVGPACDCVIGDINFLGKHVVERVIDGRIYHLSIGIDENTDTLTEVSTVIEPAAIGAMVLKKQNTLKGDKAMSKKLKAMRAARSTKMAALKAEVTKLSAKLTTTKASVTIAKRESQVVNRLSAAIRAGKLTPAEYKKMDIKKLAAMDEASSEVVLSVVDGLEPKVLVGQRGTKAGIEFAQLGKALEKKQHKQLMSEARKDLKRMGAAVKDLSEDEGDDKELAIDDKPEKKEMKSDEKSEDKDMSKLSEMDPAESEKQMSGVQAQVDELTTQVARLAGMVDELMSVEKEEADLADGEDGDEQELGAEPKEGEEKMAKGENPFEGKDKDLEKKGEDDKELSGEKEKIEKEIKD